MLSTYSTLFGICFGAAQLGKSISQDKTGGEDMLMAQLTQHLPGRMALDAHEPRMTLS